MTQEEKEFNIKCAKFLGWEHRIESNKIFGKIDKGWFNGSKISYHTDGLAFHSDWNWIMLVISHINMIPNPKNSSDTTLYTHRLNVQSILRSANKEAVIQEIDKFLDWYEKQNK